MGTSLSIEQKLDAVLKNNHEITCSNQELKAQNEYLRRQLGTFLKQKKKLNEEPSYSAAPQGEEQVFSLTLNLQVMKNHGGGHARNKEDKVTLMILELRFQNLKASSIQKNSWNGCTLWRLSLIHI